MRINLNITSLFQSRKSTGLKITLHRQGGLSWSMVKVKREKGEVEIIDMQENMADITDLKLPKGSQVPLMVSIDGKGIIHKLLNNTEGLNDTELIGQLLPNAQLSSFYLQKKPLNDGSVWVSIVRKDFIDLLLNQITERGWYINGLILGPFALSTTIRLTGIELPNPMVEEENLLAHSNGQITSIVPNKETTALHAFTIGEKELSSRGLIALGCAFLYFFKDTQLISPDYQIIEEKTADLVHHNIFRKAGVAALSFFLVVLLVNFLLFDRYNSQYDKMTSTLTENEALLAKLNILQEELESKKAFIDNSGFANASKISFAADEIARTLPASISLRKLTVNPPQKKNRSDKKTTFVFDEIQLTGVTHESIELNEWIKTAKGMPWINDITIIDFSREKNKSTAVFELLITIKKDHV